MLKDNQQLQSLAPCEADEMRQNEFEEIKPDKGLILRKSHVS